LAAKALILCQKCSPVLEALPAEIMMCLVAQLAASWLPFVIGKKQLSAH
jgi:hypothetical protein